VTPIAGTGRATAATREPASLSAGEWLLTLLIVAFIALKLAEALLFLEAWPLTHVPMFAVREAPDARPVRLDPRAARRAVVRDAPLAAQPEP
jgi:hypothetical protein